ncbi:MAG: tyrosine-type recombinase/integrase [Desulfomonilia bacterium]
MDVNREKARARSKGITLEGVMEVYFETRPNLREGIVKSYKSRISKHLSAWVNKSMVEITGEMVSRKHLDIASKSGQAQANKVMRVLRLLFNFLSVIKDKPVENPVKRLSNARQWFKVERRKTIIKEANLKAWNDAVMKYRNPVVRDYLLLLLFTGLREREGMTLRWSDVDMKGRTFTIRAEIAKNHREHTLPMSLYLFELFNQRLALRDNAWVFPGTKEGMPLIDARRAIEYVTGKTQIKWSLHDLRRTFSTFAEQEVSYSMLKRLLNHSQTSDVTAGYLVISTEQLRLPMQKVTDRMLKAIKAKEKSGKVIPLRK